MLQNKPMCQKTQKTSLQRGLNGYLLKKWERIWCVITTKWDHVAKVTMTCLYRDKLHQQNSKYKSVHASSLKHSLPLMKSQHDRRSKGRANIFWKKWKTLTGKTPLPPTSRLHVWDVPQRYHLRETEDCISFSRTHTMSVRLLCVCRANSVLHGPKLGSLPTGNKPVVKVPRKDKFSKLGMVCWSE